MKTITLFILSILLVVAILAPSVITLLDIENKTELVIDFNEEDNKKEEKKENKNKEFVSSADFDALSYLNFDFSNKASFYLEKNYSFSTSIVLPPPRIS